jgi:phage replication O-like protein O
MDNEKKENEYYLKIKNGLLGALILSGNLLTNEGKVFMLVLFKTLGFKKEKDWLSYKQICRHTGIKQKTRISEAIKKLVENKLIIREGKYFKINQNFKEWLNFNGENFELIDKYYHSKKLRKSVTNDNNDNKKLRKSVTKVTEKRNSKLRKSVTPSTDNIITDKTNTDNIHTPVNSNDHITQIEEIIDYLNDKTGKNFRSKNKKTMEKITARLGEGYNLDDFKKVINIKTAKWKDTEFDDYLRPETLFGGKFENYLNEKEIKNAKSKKYEYQKDYTEDERRKIVEGFYS